MQISMSKAADGLFVDMGTQTHLFRSAPFKGKTTLAEVMVDRPLKLRLQLQAGSVNSRHNRTNCVFTYICGHTFHRREFATHFRCLWILVLELWVDTWDVFNDCVNRRLLSRNVHSDIQTCLGEWFEQRCPLAYLGCTYRWRRFQPSTQKATVSYKWAQLTFLSTIFLLIFSQLYILKQL